MTYSPVTPIVTGYEYVGDIPALGGVQLTKLARSFEQIDDQGLEEFFPTQTINERTVIVETVKEGLGIMPIVQAGVPAGSFQHPERVERRYYQPAYVREDDFIDQLLINQLRKVGTMNETEAPLQIVQRRVQRLVNRHNRTKQLLQCMVLQGGINYTDPRTNVTLNVSTMIPKHNYFQYDGWDGTLAADGDMGLSFKANKNLTNNKGRKEALLFTSKDGKGAIPWTHPRADILKCLHYLKQYLYNTNKNMYTDVVMSRDLYTVIQQNELIQSYMGAASAVVPGFAISGSMRTPPLVEFGVGGEISSIGGLRIKLLDTLYSDPVDNQIKKLWSANTIAIVARNHVRDRSATLGYTQECIGESPEGVAGMWFRTGPDQMPPAVPGRAMQMGNAFLPFATYPQWICLMKVCEDSDLTSTLPLRADISYGTF